MFSVSSFGNKECLKICGTATEVVWCVTISFHVTKSWHSLLKALILSLFFCSPTGCTTYK